MIVVIADTSGLLVALDSTHPEHEAANQAIQSAGLLVASPLLLAELDHIATRELGRDAAIRSVDDIRRWMRRGRVVVPEVTEHRLGVAQSVRAQYSDLDLDLADAVNVTLASVYDTDAILTLDRRDFRAIHPLSRHEAFKVLPEDLRLD